MKLLLFTLLSLLTITTNLVTSDPSDPPIDPPIEPSSDPPTDPSDPPTDPSDPPSDPSKIAAAVISCDSQFSFEYTVLENAKITIETNEPKTFTYPGTDPQTKQLKELIEKDPLDLIKIKELYYEVLFKYLNIDTCMAETVFEEFLIDNDQSQILLKYINYDKLFTDFKNIVPCKKYSNFTNEPISNLEYPNNELEADLDIVISNIYAPFSKTNSHINSTHNLGVWLTAIHTSIINVANKFRKSTGNYGPPVIDSSNIGEKDESENSEFNLFGFGEGLFDNGILGNDFLEDYISDDGLLGNILQPFDNRDSFQPLGFLYPGNDSSNTSFLDRIASQTQETLQSVF